MNRDYTGNAEITLITHSMGGLVARCYLESGVYDNSSSPGYDLINNLYTLAGPHLGAPIAVIKALGQDKTIFLSRAQIKALSSSPAYPSLYEMFPHQGQPILWNTNSTPPFQAVDLYTGAGQAAGLVLANLAEADAFHKSLGTPGSLPQVRYFFFSGTQKTTAANLTAATNPNGTMSIQELARDDSGDGTVPIWSSKVGAIQTEFVGGEHSVIYKDSQLQQTLKQLLAPPAAAPAFAAFAALAAIKPAVVVTVLELVVRPNEQTQLNIALGSRATKLSGKLLFEKALLLANGELQAYQTVNAAQSVLYEGPAFDRLQIPFIAPADPAIYRVTFTLDNDSFQSGSDQFFVQTGPND